MAFPILGNPSPQFFDSSGDPLVSGTLAVLDPADDTNKASYPTYDDAEAATNANANPVVLDARGSCSLWGLDSEDYKLVLKNATGTTITTDDDIFMPNLMSIGSTNIQSISGDTNTVTVLIFTADDGNTTVTDPTFSTVIPITDDYTFTLADKGATASRTGSTATVAVTIPAEASVDYRIGTFLGVNNDGTDAITVVITSDTLTWAADNTTGTRTIAAGGYAVMQKTASTKWKIAGKQIT